MALNVVKGSVWNAVDNTGFISVKDHGAMGDGITDDTSAITAALTAAAGGTLYIPSGTYVVPVDAASMFTPSADTKIIGDGRTSIFRFNMTDATTRILFTISNSGITFEDLRIEINTSVVGGTIVGFSWSGSNFRLQNIEIDGAVTADSGTSHIFQAIKCASTGTFDNLLVDGCEIHDVTRVWLRENTSTAVVEHVKFVNNLIYNSESSTFALNAASGSLTNVVFANNTMKDPYINAVQSDSFFIGPQATNVSITGNTFLGTGHECIHLEEAATNISIVGNTINMNCAERAIYISDNNVISERIPARVAIVGNIINRTDADGTTGEGIELINDGTPEPLNFGVISNNVITGWGIGIKNGGNQDDIVHINNNIIDNCATGFSSQFGAPEFKENTLSNCTTGIVTISGGGMFGRNAYYNNTTNVNAASGEATLLGMDFRFDRVNFTATGNTEFSLFPIAANDRCHGWLTAHVYANDTSEDKHMAEVTWDGSSLTNTTKIVIGGGALTISYQDVASVLTLRVANSGSVLNDGSVYAAFDGTIVIS